MVDQNLKEALKDNPVYIEGNEDFPILFGMNGFKPSTLMCKALMAYMADTQGLSPALVIRDKLGSDYYNWYHWKKKDGFLEWWQACIESNFNAEWLPDLWKSMYKKGLQGDPQCAKLCFERFDKRYKPTTSQEHKFSNLPMPEQDSAALIEASRARERKLIKSKEIQGD
jgi:hypothetical protein